MKNITTEEWRKKHKRCKWCGNAQLCGINLPANFRTYYKCTVKDKVVKENKPRPFCRVFQLGEPSVEKPIPMPSVRKPKESI